MFTRNKKCGGEGMSCTVKEAFCDERETHTEWSMHDKREGLRIVRYLQMDGEGQDDSGVDWVGRRAGR